MTDPELVEATCAVPEYDEENDPHGGALDNLQGRLVTQHPEGNDQWIEK